MCNFIVFHRNLQSNYLKESLEKMCELNFYFAHLYYFYMKSIEKNINKMEIQTYQPVVAYNNQLRENLNNHFSKVSISSARCSSPVWGSISTTTNLLR